MCILTTTPDCKYVLLPGLQYVVDCCASLYGFWVNLQNFYSERHKEKCKSFMVTIRTNGLVSITNDMIAKRLFTRSEQTNHFGDQENRRSKGDICQQIGADIIIDDNIHHIIDSTSKSKMFGLLFGSYEWNQIEKPTVTVVIRCCNWSEVEREVERIANN